MKYFHNDQQIDEPVSSCALVTMCIGEAYESLAQLTMPTLRAYANKIGIDFVIIDEKRISTTYTMYEKYQIYDLLEIYDRIIYMDLDIIVRLDCPNLFDIVPYAMIGLFNEGNFLDSSTVIAEASKIHEIPYPEWNNQSYNAGLIVISKYNKELVTKPENEVKMYGPYPHYDQPHLTLKILSEGYQVCELDYRFNRMRVMEWFIKETPLASFIVHFAGLAGSPNFEEMIQSALDIWKRNGLV